MLKYMGMGMSMGIHVCTSVCVWRDGHRLCDIVSIDGA